MVVDTLLVYIGNSDNHLKHGVIYNATKFNYKDNLYMIRYDNKNPHAFRWVDDYDLMPIDEYKRITREEKINKILR